MLIFEFRTIGNRLYAIRKRSGLTQQQVAESAGLSDRTYADIERGTVNMRLETILRICKVLHITPDEILTTDDTEITAFEEEVLAKLRACAPRDKETALKIMNVYLSSLNEQDSQR